MAAPCRAVSVSPPALGMLNPAGTCFGVHRARGALARPFGLSEGLARLCVHRLAAGEGGPPGEDDVAVGPVQLHQESTAAGLLRGDERRSRAPKEIQHVLSRLRGV